MNTQKLSNIPLSDFREFLIKSGCKKIRVSGGHEVWVRKDLLRPIVIQTHISPVPEFIVKNILRDLKCSKQDFFNILFDCI
jgi:YcfA-like protein.